MEYKFYIPTWDEHQHYRDRNPPWIKLHFNLLSSNTWVTLDDASRALAIACMLVASRHGGKIPADDNYITRVAYLNKKPNYSPLISVGFIVPLADASTMLADASSSVSVSTSISLSEKGGVGGKKKPPETYSHDFLELWKLYPRKDGSKAKAFEIYQRTGVDHGTIERGVRAYAESVRGTESKYIAHFTTWLNQRRWEADYSIPKQPVGKPTWKSEGERLAEKYRIEAQRQEGVSSNGEPALRLTETIR